MARKTHLQHSTKSGPVCKAGKSGAALAMHGGEHFTVRYAEFVAATDSQCAKCKATKLFAFLNRK